jgi:subtilisin family serine protease
MRTTNHATPGHPSHAMADRPAPPPAAHRTGRTPGRRLGLAILLVAFITAACNAPILRDPSLGGGHTGEGVRIALLDGPIEAHPQFDVGAGRVFNDNDSAVTNINDWHRNKDHGMLVASAIKRVAPGADIAVYSWKKPHFLANINVRLGDLIIRAVEDGSDIIVIASSIDRDPGLHLKAGIEWARNAGVLVVTSAGNNGDLQLCPEGSHNGQLDEGQILLPTSYIDLTNLLSVGGSANRIIWRCSIRHPAYVHFFASALLPDGAIRNGGTATVQGTSFSAPFAAGSAALLIEQDETYRGDPPRLIAELVRQARAKPVIPNAEIDSSPQDSFDDAIFVERIITFIDDAPSPAQEPDEGVEIPGSIDSFDDAIFVERVITFIDDY